MDSDFKRFEENKNDFYLVVCPKCESPMKVYKGKEENWVEFQVCEKCEIALDDTR